MHTTSTSHVTASAASTQVLLSVSSPESLQMREWLTFKLGGEEYGIDILSVQEIRSYEKPTAMVNAPAVLKGVINLRGIIVPIVDMRIHFNLPEVSYNAFTVVIVLNVDDSIIGMVIDGVSDVTRFAIGHVKAAPRLANVGHANHIQGIGHVGDRTLLLLDIQSLIRSTGMGVASSTLQ